MLAYFTLGLMIAILIVQAVLMIYQRKTAQLNAQAFDLIHDTVKMLTQRVQLLERRMKARADQAGS